ncbi:hypothetical protein BU25DRAFT_492733 [Macroventuria anomochaeta]|uniref:Uncharacterized protein n=1 Tax=Macroventuria anomochaeta TaxID=301207 RepID=A0ACB6RUH3_9PLEO|nr:uncharacterized protein BU25DRAFT_492733 [Macroventuria anomochaeta]KAF2625443.1 hypothetical protein BU25DRAFT_492733 [Macroventuria anomochaeta]
MRQERFFDALMDDPLDEEHEVSAVVHAGPSRHGKSYPVEVDDDDESASEERSAPVKEGGQRKKLKHTKPIGGRDSDGMGFSGGKGGLSTAGAGGN